MKYPNPCEQCRRPCKSSNSQAKTCPDYRAYINAWWKFFNICYRRMCRYTHGTNSEKFAYEHPGEIRRYLERGPCPDCKANQKCDTPCATYWKWWDARMAWFRRRLRK